MLAGARAMHACACLHRRVRAAAAHLLDAAPTHRRSPPPVCTVQAASCEHPVLPHADGGLRLVASCGVCVQAAAWAAAVEHLEFANAKKHQTKTSI